MDLQLNGLTAVVTGGSRGIGAAIVRGLSEEGCNVHFCARDPAHIELTARACAALPGRATGACVDVTDVAAVGRWFASVGGFDILVSNVSALSRDWERTLDVDVRATLALTEAALVHLASSKFAAITYIGSKAASLPSADAAAYGAAKAAMAHSMKSLALRLAPKVRVNVVSPGDTLVQGGFWDRVRDDDPQAFARAVARNPMGRLAHADEVARVAVFVSSPAASFVSGANWYVDGASTSHVQF